MGDMSAINLGSPNWAWADSYGRVARELDAGLRNLGFPVNTWGDGAPRNHVGIGAGGILLGYPTHHPKFGALLNMGYRMALTMFESNQLPPEWKKHLNQCGDVVVPSRAMLGIFRRSGVKARLHHIPLGISDVYKQIRRRRWDGSRPLTFLALADRGHRKGWWEAVQAFLGAFGEDERFRLILKARHFPLRVENPNIELITGDYTDEEMLNLYHRAHVMLFPTKGEGFGFPPREFVATGGIALATRWGGTADHLDDWGWGIPYEPEIAWRGREDWHGKLGYWARADSVSLWEIMRDIADNFDGYASQALDKAAFVHDTYRWDDFARSLSLVYTEGVSHARAGRE
jgi:glycosyltransferase involved in cell wall biosynthesis